MTAPDLCAAIANAPVAVPTPPVPIGEAGSYGQRLNTSMAALLAERTGVSISERTLTCEQKREYGSGKAWAEREAEEFLAWLDGPVEPLREVRQ
jgi:hypothetical protein